MDDNPYISYGEFGILWGAGASYNAIQRQYDCYAAQIQTLRRLIAGVDSDANALVLNSQRLDCIIAGRQAYVRHVKSTSPECEAFVATNQRHANGQPMTRADVEFAAGFDDTAKMTDAEYLIEERRVGKILAA